MRDEIKTLVQYRVERAKESIIEAKLMFEKGHINTYVNRLYYACFYIVSALLLTKGLSSSKHSGIRSLFHQHYVKSGIIDINKGLLYDKLYDNRQKGDYADLVYFKADDVKPWLKEVEEFVETIQNIITKEI